MRAACTRVRRLVNEDTRGCLGHRIRLPAFTTGRGFRCPDPLRPSFGSLEEGQLPAGPVVLMLQLLKLRLEVGLLLLVQRRTFFTRELHPVTAILGSFDPFFQ